MGTSNIIHVYVKLISIYIINHRVYLEPTTYQNPIGNLLDIGILIWLESNFNQAIINSAMTHVCGFPC